MVLSARRRVSEESIRMLGRYHVLGEIGRNHVGPALLARLEGPKGFQRWATVRRVERRHLANEAFMRTFYDRAREGAGLMHANVATLFELGEDPEAPWIATEYLMGESVEELLARAELAGTPVSWSVAARIIADAAEGVSAIARATGSPCDLVPYNTIVLFEGKTKIEGAFEPHALGLARTGKLAYSAPEQLFDESIDERADVFALGVMLWELCAGKRLFERETEDETRAMVEAHAVPLLVETTKGVPPAVDRVVARALARKRDERFNTGHELSRALEACIVDAGVVMRPEDVARYMRSVFADRIAEKREQLAEAAEVTEVFRAKRQQSGDDHAVTQENLAVTQENEAPKTEPMLPPDPQSERTLSAPVESVRPQRVLERVTDEDVPTVTAMRRTDEIPTVVVSQELPETPAAGSPVMAPWPAMNAPTYTPSYPPPSVPPPSIHPPSLPARSPSRSQSAAVALIGAAVGATIFVVVLATTRRDPAPQPVTQTQPQVASLPRATATATLTHTAPSVVTTVAPPVSTVVAFPPVLDPTQLPTTKKPVATVQLAPKPPPIPPPTVTTSANGQITIMCKPACDDVLDGATSLGPTPIYRKSLSAGKHRLTLRVDSTGVKKTITVDVPDGDILVLRPDMQ